MDTVTTKTKPNSAVMHIAVMCASLTELNADSEGNTHAELKTVDVPTFAVMIHDARRELGEELPAEALTLSAAIQTLKATITHLEGQLKKLGSHMIEETEASPNPGVKN